MKTKCIDDVKILFLTDEEIERLDKTIPRHSFVISHVGDGEYTCNVFGNIFSSFSKALERARILNPRYVISKEIQSLPDGRRLSFYYIGYIITWKDGTNHSSEDALLTIEGLDYPFNQGR